MQEKGAQPLCFAKQPAMASGHVPPLYATRRLLVVFLAIGFLVLTIEGFLEHYFAVRSIKPAQWIPIPFGLLAASISFGVAIHFTARALKLFQLCYVLAVLVGGLGLYFYCAALWRTLDGLYSWQTSRAVLSRGAPVFAPTSFTTLGLLGSVLTSDKAIRSLVLGTRSRRIR